MKKYSIYAALREDINSGWVWGNDSRFKKRVIVCLSNPKARKKIYCEGLGIDKNFLKNYDEIGGGRKLIQFDKDVLVVNEWYRKLLSLDDWSNQSEYELDITIVDNWIGKLWSCFHHPQIIVRIASRLAVISVIEGIIGIVLGAISICK